MRVDVGSVCAKGTPLKKVQGHARRKETGVAGKHACTQSTEVSAGVGLRGGYTHGME